MNNPYQTPERFSNSELTVQPDTEVPIHFQGEVAPSDMKQLFSGWWLPLMVLAFSGYLGFDNWQWFRWFFLQRDTLGLIAILVIIIATVRWAAVQLWYRIGPGFSNYFRNGFPDLFIWFEGTLQEDWLEIANQNRATILLRSSIVKAFGNHQTLWLLFDSIGAEGYFFTRSMFAGGDFERFVAAVTADVKKNQRGYVTSWNNKEKTERSRILPLPEDDEAKIVFGGTLTKGDALLPPVSQRIARAVFWLMLDVAFSAVVFAAIGYLLMHIMPVLGLFCIALVLLAGRRFYNKFAVLGLGVPKDRKIMSLKGQVSPEGLCVCTPLSSSNYRWSAFEDLFISDQAVALRLRGNSSGWLIFPHHFFADQNDWEAACRTFKTQLGKPNRSE